jgi:hypothetical protein
MKDFLGQELNPGDLVVISHPKYQQFDIAIIKKIAKARCGVTMLTRYRYNDKLSYKSNAGMCKISYSQLPAQYVDKLPLKDYMKVLKAIKESKSNK